MKNKLESKDRPVSQPKDQTSPVKSTKQERDPYEGYTRKNPPPWLDEFEYIDFMMTH